LNEMKHLATAYAQKKTVIMLTNLDFGNKMGEKIGRDLAKSAATDHLDMVTMTPWTRPACL
ncbi:MAG: hypothetical protein B6245_24030, partial [Desulfobacteraceae bacterium 4572_88]